MAEINHAGDELREIFDGVMTCRPAVPPDKLNELADMVMSPESVGRPWRLAMLLGSKSGAFYEGLTLNADSARTFAPAVRVLEDFAQRLRAVAQVAECSSARLRVAGCAHEDFDTWVDDDVS